MSNYFGSFSSHSGSFRFTASLITSELYVAPASIAPFLGVPGGSTRVELTVPFETLLTVLIAPVLACLPMFAREGGKVDGVSPARVACSAVELKLVGVGGVAPPGLPSARPDIFLLIPALPPLAALALMLPEEDEEEERPPPLRLTLPGVTKPLLVVGVPSALEEMDEEDMEGGIPPAPSALAFAESLLPAPAADGVLGPRMGAAKLKALPGLLGVVTDAALFSLSC